MLRFLSLFAALVATAAASCPVGNMDNLVSFGDSYTDESRRAYIQSHDGRAPPPGTLLPANNVTSTGGLTWGRYVADKTDTAYYNYAVSGATCSNEIVKRNFAAINAPYPSVFDYEAPAYEADTAFKTLYPDRHAANTVYAIWIGTNDLGFGGFLTNSQAPGTTLESYIECIWQVFDDIYKTGGRRFALLNVVPLELSVTYAAGSGNSPFWPNHTSYPQKEYEDKMHQQTTDVNTQFNIDSLFHFGLRGRWPGASLTILDVNRIFRDIHSYPDEYLSKPANVTSCYHRCPPGKGCQNSEEPESSFLWYDELHPTARTSEIVADNFIKAIKGESPYGRCYS